MTSPSTRFLHHCFTCRAVFGSEAELRAHIDADHSARPIVDTDAPSADVRLYRGVTRLDLSPDRVLDNTPRDLVSVIILGYTADGREYFDSSYADGADALWLLERLKLQLLTVETPPATEG